MQYQYTQKRNFEDYASGRVFYNFPGQPAFPVRLASEIFQRASRYWHAEGGTGLCNIYDPVCGGGYWLVVLAYLHWADIASIFASDIENEVLPLVERNLSLITPAGLNQRITKIKTMLSMYHKESHTDALRSARKFRDQLAVNLESHAIDRKIFQADATNPESIKQGLGNKQVNLVLADVPYGWHSEWRTQNEDLKADQTPVWKFLDAMHAILEPGAVVTIIANKNQKVKHDRFRRCERFQIGKRRIFILQINH
jgi:hypothetical protein